MTIARANASHLRRDGRRETSRYRSVSPPAAQRTGRAHSALL